jgi:preprotein translocase subunit SecG
MMYGLVMGIHVLASLVLIGIILVQGGRGGLSDVMGGGAAQSLFGGGAATALTRITAICAAVFGLTCLSLAYLSTVRGRSVIEQMPASLPGGLPLTMPVPQAPAPPTEAASPTPASSEPTPSQ